MHGVNLRNNAAVLPPSTFAARRVRMVEQFKDGTFLADPDARGKPKPNPMTDPSAMEGMMGAMKGNVAMMVPQTLIMSWINAFFSGFVLCESAPASCCKIANLIRRISVNTIITPTCVGYLNKVYLLTYRNSEASFPSHTAVQVYATIRRWNPRPRCEMGLIALMVLLNPLRPAACLQLHLGKQ